MKILFNVTKQPIIVTLNLGIKALELVGKNEKNKKQSQQSQNTVTFDCLRKTYNQDDQQIPLQITQAQQQQQTQNCRNLEIGNQEISNINMLKSINNDNNQEDYKNSFEKQEIRTEQNNLKQNSFQENKEGMSESQEKEISQQEFAQDNVTFTQKNEQPQDIDQNIEVNEPIEEFKEQEQDQPIEQIRIQEQNNQEKQQNNDSEQEVSPQINQQSSAIEQNNEINNGDNDQQQQQPIEQENFQEEQQNNDSEQEVSPQIKEQSPAIEKNNDINNDQQQQQPIEQENNFLQAVSFNRDAYEFYFGLSIKHSTQINEQSSVIEQNNEINKTIEENNEQQQQQPILEQENNQDKQQNKDKLQETINLLNKIFDTSYRWRAVDVQYKNFVSEQMSQTELIQYYFPSKKNYYKKQIQGIKQELIGYRRIRGDGNCFYTAFAFQYFQILLTDKQRREQFEQKISTLKVSTNYQQIKIENNEDIPQLFLDEFRKINDEKELLDQISDPDKLFYGLSIIVLRNYIVDLYQNNDEIRSLGNNFIVPEILEWEKECNTNELIITLLAKELKLIIIVHLFDLKNNTYNKTKYGKEDENLELPQIIFLLAPGHYQVGIPKK